MPTLTDAIQDIEQARWYTNDLINHVEHTDWFRQPAEGVTHIAWQIGHISIAQHRLALVRIHGSRPTDDELIPASYADLFGKGSVPQADATLYPTVDELRSVFDRVHQKVIEDNSVLPESVLGETPDGPVHPMFTTKIGALAFSAKHEFFHAGQIALIRRLLGFEALR